MQPLGYCISENFQCIYRSSFILFIATKKSAIIFHNEPNPFYVYSLANTKQQRVTQPDTHSDSVHVRPAHYQHQKKGQVTECIQYVHYIMWGPRWYSG